jgi:hypothetical protein
MRCGDVFAKAESIGSRGCRPQQVAEVASPKGAPWAVRVEDAFKPFDGSFQLGAGVV